MRHDFTKSWAAYRAWMEVMYARLDVFRVDRAPKLDAREAWIDVLGAAVCVLAMDYSSGTISVFVTR